MEPITLDQLARSGCVIYNEDGITVAVPSSWIVAGEDRLSYTTMVRLVECCREYHWEKDVIAKAVGVGSLDSICKSLACEFFKPVLVNSVVSISYRVTGVRQKGYSLRFGIRDTGDRSLCAAFDIILVFYDSATHKAVAPPSLVLDYLRTAVSKGSDIT
jgi:acyl-CoA thioesterase FadM